MATTTMRAKVMMGIRVTPSTRTTFRVWCTQRGQTIQQVIERADPSGQGVGQARTRRVVAAVPPIPPLAAGLRSWPRPTIPPLDTSALEIPVR